MGIFDDKTFENMDFLSQAVEPYVSPINDILAKLPDEHVFDGHQVIETIAESYSHRFTRDEGLRILFALHSVEADYHEMRILTECFKLETSPTIQIDAELNEIEGEIRLVKTTNIIEDKVIKGLMADRVSLPYRANEVYNDALMELGMLFFDDPKHTFFETKPTKNKLYLLSEELRDGAFSDKFKIRSAEVYGDFVKLINLYLSEKTETALGSIFRILTMAKRGQVIYSIGK